MLTPVIESLAHRKVLYSDGFERWECKVLSVHAAIAPNKTCSNNTEAFFMVCITVAIAQGSFYEFYPATDHHQNV